MSAGLVNLYISTAHATIHLWYVLEVLPHSALFEILAKSLYNRAAAIMHQPAQSRPTKTGSQTWECNSFQNTTPGTNSQSYIPSLSQHNTKTGGKLTLNIQSKTQTCSDMGVPLVGKIMESMEYTRTLWKLRITSSVIKKGILDPKRINAMPSGIIRVMKKYRKTAVILIINFVAIGCK